MEINDFGHDLDESAQFLVQKLLILHPWDEEWNLSVTAKLVPFYKEKIDLQISKQGKCDEEFFDKLIRFSSILDTNQVRLLFMEQLVDMPLILDGKYLNNDERIDLLIESLNGRLKRVDNGLYLFFNHEEEF